MNWNILIIEDDSFIAENFKEAFFNAGFTNVKISNYINDALLLIQSETFDLFIVDIMLPKSEENYKKIGESQRELTIIRREMITLDQIQNKESPNNRINELREKRSSLLNRIDELIEMNGGINLISQIQGDSKYNQPKAIIFLSALGNEEIVNDGLNKSKVKSRWLIKPINSELLIKISIDLLSNSN
jgi:DNA-binding response OmpR family regulator